MMQLPPWQSSPSLAVPLRSTSPAAVHLKIAKLVSQRALGPQFPAKQRSYEGFNAFGRMGAAVCSAATALSFKQRRLRFQAPNTARTAVAENGMAEAVAENRMITLEESAIRKALGALFGVLFAWQAWLVCTTGATTIDIGGSSYTVLAVLASNCVGFGVSGFLSL